MQGRFSLVWPPAAMAKGGPATACGTTNEASAKLIGA